MYPPPGNVACKQTPPEPLNACGNNKTEGDEFCDDGVLLNNTYGHCKSDCTGMGPFCGDGSTNGDGAKNKEDCDDGLENGKCGKCKTDCTAGSACPKSPQAVRVGALLDTNADGSLTPREMFRGVLSMVRAIITQNLAFDLNDDGAVNRSDLKDLVTELRAEIAGNV